MWKTFVATIGIVNLRLVLDVEVQAGNCSAAKYTSLGLFDFLDSLPHEKRARCLRSFFSGGGR